MNNVIQLINPDNGKTVTITITPVPDSNYVWVSCGGVGAYRFQRPIKVIDRWVRTGIMR